MAIRYEIPRRRHRSCSISERPTESGGVALGMRRFDRRFGGARSSLKTRTSDVWSPLPIPTPERLTSTLALNYSWSTLLSFFLSTWIKITRPRSKRAAIPLLPSFEQFHLSPTPPEKSSKPGRFAKRNDSNIQSTLRESVSPRESVPCVSLGKKRPRNTRRDWNSGGSPISIEERGNIFLGEVKIGRSGYTARCTLAHWHFHRVPMSGDRRNNGRHRAHDRYVTFPPL